MNPHAARPLRSVLYVPAGNERALAKAATLGADALILDLEDAVAPQMKEDARRALVAWHSARPDVPGLTVIRINALSTEWGAADLALAVQLAPDAILLPKVDTPRDLLEVGDALDEADPDGAVRLWAMVETPRGLLNIGALAELGRDPAARLSALVAGTNDLARETGTSLGDERRYAAPWLMQIVLAARAGHLAAIDGVMNDFSDEAGFVRECAQGAAMGFDGKTLIHPRQIGPANAAFSPSADAIAEARSIVAAFADPAHAGRGAIALGGRMVERLHLEGAERLLARAGLAAEGSGQSSSEIVFGG